MRIILIILTLFTPFKERSDAEVICDCFPLNTKTINTLKSRSDLIAIGKPVEKIKGETDYEEDMIVFEIDSLIKGNSEIHTVLINQNIAGNCAATFELCKEYLLTGDEIKNAKATYSMGQTGHSQKLEKLVNNNYTVSTNGCRFFPLNSDFAKQFLSNKY